MNPAIDPCNMKLNHGNAYKMKPAIDPYNTRLNQGNAYWMARIARAIYFKLGELHQNPEFPDEARILADLSQHDHKFISVTGVAQNSAQAALIEHEDYMCMAFRGTDELKDWLDNFNLFREHVLFGEFHRGFYYSVEDVWQDLFDRYCELKAQRSRPLLITGHSLGGAMASVAAAKLIHQDHPFISCYTFGQPRAMTQHTARLFNVEAKSKVFRFQNNNDIVTRAPARLTGYSHAGTYLYIGEDGKIHPDVGLWYRFLDVATGAVDSLRETGNLDAIADHAMDHYLQAVARWFVVELRNATRN